MATPFETFVNGELPKRVSTEDSPLSWTNGQVLTTTGVGLGVEAVDANTLGFEPSITGSGVATEFLNGNKVFTSVTATSIGAIPTSEKGAADGVATLDTDGKIPLSQIPAAAVERVVIVADETARFALTTATVQQGDVVDQQTPKAIYFVVDDAELDNAAGYSELVAGTAAAVAWSGVTGIPVIISDIAAVSGSVDGDVLQRVAGTWVNRTAAQLKTSLAIETSDVSGLSTALGLKADLASPTFTGTVTVPTATAGDSSTAAASTAFVAGEISTNAQPKDATLTALAAYNTNGIVVQTAADTFAGRSLAAGQGITILNPSAVAANPTISITDTAVTPGIYGSASKIPIFVVDSMGRTTDASEVDNGIFSDSVFRIQDNLAPTKQMAYELSSITAGQTRTITMPDRDVTVGSLPPFAASTHYGQRAIIQEAGLMYSAKVDFTSGAAFDLADWDAVGSLGLKVKVLGYGESTQTLEVGYEHINVNGTNLSSVVYEMPDPEFVPDGSKVVIHNLGFDGSTTLGTTNWTQGGESRFAKFPNYYEATTSSIPAYSRGVITTLTSLKAYKLWVQESHRPSNMLPTGDSMRFYREDDITATITNYLGNIPAATNRVITYPNSNVDLGKTEIQPYVDGKSYNPGDVVHDGTQFKNILMCGIAQSSGTIDSMRWFPVGTYRTRITTNTAYVAQRWYSPTSDYGNMYQSYVTLDGTVTALTLSYGAVVNEEVTLYNSGSSAIAVTMPAGTFWADTNGSIANPLQLNEQESFTIVRSGNTAGTQVQRVRRSRPYFNSGAIGLHINKQNSETAWAYFDASALTTGRAITLPDANVDLGQPLISAAYSTTTGLITFGRTNGGNTTVDMANMRRYVDLPSGIAPTQPNISTLFKLNGGTSIAINVLSGGKSWEFYADGDYNLDLTGVGSGVMFDDEGNVLQTPLTSYTIAMKARTWIRVTGLSTYWVVENLSNRTFRRSGALGLVSTVSDAGNTKLKTTFVRSSGAAFTTNTTVTFPDADVNLGNVPTALTYSPSTATLSTGGLSTNIAPISDYAAGVVYSVGALVYHQQHTWKVIVAHTGSIPFVNGRLELLGEVFRVFVQTTPYLAPRLGANTGALGVADKILDVNLYNNSATTVDISNAPAKIIIRQAFFTGSKALTITKTHATLDVSLIGDDGTTLVTPALTVSHTFNLTAGAEVEILNFSSSAVIFLKKQNTIGRFKLNDVSSTLDANKNNGWLFSGTATDARTITLPNANVNLGYLSSVATTDGNVLGGTDCRIEGGNNNNVSGTNSSTYMCQYQTVTGTNNRAISSRPTTGTGVFTHAGNGNTYYNHRHNGNTIGSSGSNCTFYDCYGIVGAAGDVNVVYRSAGMSSGVTMYGFIPHTQVTGNGVSASPLRAVCMLQSPPALTGVPAVLVSLVAGAVQDKPPLFRNGGNGAYHDIVLNAYDTNLYPNPKYMLCLRRQVTVYHLSSTPVISITTLGTDLNPSNLTFTVSVSVVNSTRMEITVTATDPVSPAPPIPLTYVWSAVVESTYF